MYCKKCGAQIRPGFAYCGSCGAATNEPQAAPGGYIDRPTSASASYRYAGFWTRVGAALLDGLAAFTLAVIPMILFGIVLYAITDSAQGDAFTTLERQDREDNNALAAVLGAVGAFTIVSYAYQVIATAHGGGWGKRAVGIRVVRDGTRENPGYGKALARVFVPVGLGLVPLVGSLLTLIDILWMIWDDDKQTWHDKAAGTVVVHHIPESRSADAPNFVTA